MGEMCDAISVPLAMADDCVDCHRDETRSIVADWQISRHQTEDVGCRDCHKGKHTSADDVDKLKTVTADTCGRCHEERLEQFSKGKHALAWAAFKAMPTTHQLPATLVEGMKGCGGCHKIGLKSEEEIAAAANELVTLFTDDATFIDPAWGRVEGIAAIKEFLIAKRLADEVDRTFLHGIHGHFDVTMGSDEDDRQARLTPQ